ncbi:MULTISPECIES: hypothetical protein [Chryseobacterium]|jgi:uncharacterized protein YacL|uniref:Uncharacterized protein YacL n=1 Tax=Chryseobacterium rhizosphaerae TaxID=395937 RepID=A0AAE3YE43_9FLAO|nr:MULTISPECIES: hypothetical protein [Chryseobacterium]MBL3549898.1 hypothetical protein [Chryseobacterium sp. KMC2]MDR6528428.1 uncharacterized protein YacL [Chryseobacterium rhizosphaerae]
MSILRQILAVVVGLIVGSIGIAIVENIGHQLYPPPVGTDPNDMEALKEYVGEAPFMALFFIIMAYALAAFVSGFTATKISNNGKHTAAIICGIIFLLITIYMMTSLPTPIWFWVLGILVWILVMAGSQLALKTKKI